MRASQALRGLPPNRHRVAVMERRARLEPSVEGIAGRAAHVEGAAALAADGEYAYDAPASGASQLLGSLQPARRDLSARLMLARQQVYLKRTALGVHGRVCCAGRLVAELLSQRVSSERDRLARHDGVLTGSQLRRNAGTPEPPDPIPAPAPTGHPPSAHRRRDMAASPRPHRRRRACPRPPCRGWLPPERAWASVPTPRPMERPALLQSRPASRRAPGRAGRGRRRTRAPA